MKLPEADNVDSDSSEENSSKRNICRPGEEQFWSEASIEKEKELDTTEAPEDISQRLHELRRDSAASLSDEEAGEEDSEGMYASEDEDLSDPLPVVDLRTSSPHTSEDEDDEDDDEMSDEEEYEEETFNTSQVRDLISSVDDYVQAEQASSDSEEELPLIPENVLEELKGEAEFYRTNFYSMEAKAQALSSEVDILRKENKDMSDILEKHVETLDRAGNAPEYVIMMSEQIPKLEREVDALRRENETLRLETVSMSNRPRLASEATAWTDEKVKVLAEENKHLKYVIDQQRSNLLTRDETLNTMKEMYQKLEDTLKKTETELKTTKELFMPEKSNSLRSDTTANSVFSERTFMERTFTDRTMTLERGGTVKSMFSQQGEAPSAVPDLWIDQFRQLLQEELCGLEMTLLQSLKPVGVSAKTRRGAISPRQTPMVSPPVVHERPRKLHRDSPRLSNKPAPLKPSSASRRKAKSTPPERRKKASASRKKNHAHLSQAKRKRSSEKPVQKSSKKKKVKPAKIKTTDSLELFPNSVMGGEIDAASTEHKTPSKKTKALVKEGSMQERYNNTREIYHQEKKAWEQKQKEFKELEPKMDIREKKKKTQELRGMKIKLDKRRQEMRKLKKMVEKHDPSKTPRAAPDSNVKNLLDGI